MRFVDVLFFFSTEFDEKDMTTVPGSHLVEPRVYSKASFLILFGVKKFKALHIRVQLYSIPITCEFNLNHDGKL